MKKFLSVIFIISLFISCAKQSSSPAAENSFVFGIYYGICYDDCADLYKIKDNSLYHDMNTTSLYLSPLIFSTTAMPNNKYLIAKPVQDSFPAYIENSTDTSFGCPDCHDQGMIYIEKTTNSIKKSWTIDTDEPAIPVEIRNYVQQVKAVITQL
jgi:hypothetical protein